MLELGHLHAQLEASKQLDPLLETLVQEPVYEFYPLGLGFRGGERTRRYYEQFFVGFAAGRVGQRSCRRAGIRHHHRSRRSA